MANVSIRMDDNLKKQAEDLFNDLGMNLTTAFTIFVKQAIREQGIESEIRKTHIDGVMSMIKVEHANKTFSGKYGKVHALQDVSIHVEKGDIYGIIG